MDEGRKTESMTYVIKRTREASPSVKGRIALIAFDETDHMAENEK